MCPVRPVRRFGVRICLVLFLWLMAPAGTFAQGGSLQSGFAPGSTDYISSRTFRAWPDPGLGYRVGDDPIMSGSGQSGALPGSFDVGFNVGSESGANFNAVDVSYSLPVDTKFTDVAQLMLLGTTIKFVESEATYGWPTTIGRASLFGSREVRQSLYAGVSGDFDISRREDRWFPGGSFAIQLDQFTAAYEHVSLRVRYFTESAGDLTVIPTNSSGWESIGYVSFGSSWEGPRVAVFAHGYNLTSAEKNDGYFVGAYVTASKGLLELKGSTGKDSTYGSHYRLGLKISMSF
jgi:hypothetical protein